MTGEGTERRNSKAQPLRAGLSVGHCGGLQGYSKITGHRSPLSPRKPPLYLS